ncbi:DUF1435 domain-containing protein [Tatumella saanichensis]|uniref:DUF1435 domain-containing protein n=1 Tax=Tatumella saanichensis TaxID=480813 RepID=UPI0004A28296|nr:DUF1435 domain-containing protein [Tatumella saanichensis]
MEAAMVASGSLWVVSWILGKKIDSGWGVLLPCAALPVFALWHPGFEQWRLVMLAAFLLTLVTLLHPRLRTYLLLPSCLVLSGGIGALIVNFS